MDSIIVYELMELLRIDLKTYSDYPESAKNNAKRALKWKKENGSKCGTPVGWTRANQLASGEALTRSTIARMASFKRHQQNKDVPYSEGCGGLMWDAWGGSAGVNWAISKLKQIDKKKLSKEYIKVNDDYAVINGRLAYSTKAKAEQVAEDLGCKGHHIHKESDMVWYMPCEQHELYEKSQKCPKGYVKRKGKCVKKDGYAKVGKRGGIVKSPKAPGSGTPNKNPKGKGSAGGSAKGKTGAKVTAKDRATLQKKANDFNKRYKDKLGYGVTVGMLSSVYQRGLGAFNTSHSPNVKSASQWGFARVNAFLYLIKNGRSQNAKYTQDYDILPKKHPKSSK